MVTAHPATTRRTPRRRAVNASPPYQLTWWDNPAWKADEPVDQRTKSALQWVERKTGIKIIVLQGSYQAKFGGGATASAHTHDQGGVVDVATAHLSRLQRIKLNRWAKRAGFAAWYRNWPGNRHAHWVLRGHRDLHPEAAAQVRSYDAHRDGLFHNLWDRTWRPRRPRRWNHRRNRPIVKR